MTGGLLDLDRRLLVILRTRGHPTWLESAVGRFSATGEHGAGWLGLGLIGAALDRDRREQWLRGARVVATAYGLNYALKLALRRRRPELPGLPPLTGVVSSLSLPSAHATTSFAAATSYRGLIPGPWLYGVAVLFALSRPYLGVHYPSDVIVGAALGTVVAR